MAMREEKYIARRCKRALDDSLSPCRNLRDRLAARYSVAPDGPAGAFLLNIPSGAPFVVSVVPLLEACFNRSSIAVPGKSTSFFGPLHWARQHKIERVMTPPEEPAELPCTLLAVKCKWQIRCSGVLAGGAPFGFSVTN